MAYVPVPRVTRIAIRQSLHLQDVVNVFHMEFPTSADLGGLQAVATRIRDWFIAEVLPFQSDQLTLRDVTCTGLDASDAPTFTLPAAEGTNGDTLGESLPGTCALVVTLRSASRGRSARGRQYIGGIPEGSHANGLVSSVFATGIADAYNVLRTDVAGQLGGQLVIVSRQQDGVPRAVGRTYPVVSAEVRDLVIDSMRRRKVGNGS